MFVKVERVVLAKRGRVRAMELNILKGLGRENGGVSEGKRPDYWLIEVQWKLEELTRDLACFRRELEWG